MENYTHTVDKTAISTVNILGVNVAAINMDWLLAFTCEHIKELSGDYICVTNVHTVVTAYKDAEYRTIQNNSILAIPDGGPLSFIGQRRGYRNMSRTPGPNYMGEILKISAKKGYKHYFYGSTNETLEKIKENLKKSYPDIQIVGMYSPPFRMITDEEDKEIVETINKASPDFLWIGLGAPKQEKWMAEHKGKVKGVMVGVGAAFDYLAGNIERAPNWMQKSNLEWVYRLIQDPRRLFKRYLITNTKFIWHIAIKRGKK